MTRLTTQHIMVAVTASVLMACANTAPTDPPMISLDDFSAQDRPTKTLNTPWGSQAVYDPTQDPDVVAAFDYVKQMRRKRGSADTASDLAQYDQYFETIRQIQLNDLARLGCAVPAYPGCGQGEFENSIRANCEAPAFGSRALTDCEADNLTPINFDVIRAQDAAVCYADFEHIGTQKRAALGKADINEYFKSECLEFVTGE